jgi:transcriptional adapter 3
MPSSNLKAKAKAARDRQSQSRNSTPVPSAMANVKSDRHRRDRSMSPYLHTSLVQPATRAAKLSNSPLVDLFESHSTVGIPSSASLNVISNSIKTQLLNVIDGRDKACDQMMRELASRQKERAERYRHRDLEQAKRQAEERRLQQKKSGTPKTGVPGQDRPLAIGAHGVARQDGAERADTSPISSVASREPSAADPNAKDAGTPNSEDAPHQPPPAATVQQYQVFGEDPSTFPDPTIYEIRQVTDDMPEDEKKEIFGVAGYPPSDLYDLTPGIPPDRDFSSAKPASQISASTFQNFVEPYLKPLTPEDLAFLSERVERHKPFHIPKRGRSYKEKWAEEDGTMVLDPDFLKLPANEARGGIELMNDDMAETDNISTGPVASRWLSLMQPVTRFAQEGDQPAVNGASSNDMDIDGENGEPRVEPQQAATTFPESTWRNVPHQPPAPDYSTLDGRLLEELRYAGFLSAADGAKPPDYNDVADDEVTARLRYLQRELRRVMVLNGARKARVLEIANERMAVQEWQGIADDLDGQLNQAYLKRTRAGNKPKKQVKRPGAPGVAGVAGVARPGGGVGEPIRSLMERREQWSDLIGPVVSHGQTSIPKGTIFDKESIDRLTKVEQENWVEEEIED